MSNSGPPVAGVQLLPLLLWRLWLLWLLVLFASAVLPLPGDTILTRWRRLRRRRCW